MKSAGFGRLGGGIFSSIECEVSPQFTQPWTLEKTAREEKEENHMGAARDGASANNGGSRLQSVSVVELSLLFVASPRGGLGWDG